MTDSSQSSKCPVCGQGDLVDILFVEGSPAGEIGEEVQLSDTRQVEAYSCGHEVVGPSLEEGASATEALEVEHRSSEETSDSPEA